MKTPMHYFSYNPSSGKHFLSFPGCSETFISELQENLKTCFLSTIYSGVFKISAKPMNKFSTTQYYVSHGQRVKKIIIFMIVIWSYQHGCPWSLFIEFNPFYRISVFSRGFKFLVLLENKVVKKFFELGSV